VAVIEGKHLSLTLSLPYRKGLILLGSIFSYRLLNLLGFFDLELILLILNDLLQLFLQLAYQSLLILDFFETFGLFIILLLASFLHLFYHFLNIWLLPTGHSLLYSLTLLLLFSQLSSSLIKLLLKTTDSLLELSHLSLVPG